jgi:hypothetical protein
MDKLKSLVEIVWHEMTRPMDNWDVEEMDAVDEGRATL